MPLDPQFVQRASQERTPAGITRVNFQNMSSQMMNPGVLPQFFGSENRAEPMPVTLAHALSVPENKIPEIATTDIASMSRAETMSLHFDRDSKSKRVAFHTSSMRAWGVPLDYTELHSD
jgi:hypothetical protein